MSVLIDLLIESSKGHEQEIDGRWYVAKPLDFYGWHTVKKRVKDAYRVLTGKSYAYHYYEQQKKE